ncbi:MAG: DMT family transporter [Firmicutes bacterium]|nr:DMT family transporter [Bacillota bacterium]
MPKPNNRFIFIQMILVAFFWGGTFNAAGFALSGLHPLTIAFLRFAISTAVLLLIGYREIAGTPIKIGDWLNFILLGLTGIFAYNAFFLYAMKYTSPISASLIVAINPIVTAVLASLLLKEKFTLRLAGGALISIIGVMLVISEGSWQLISSLKFNFGDILTLGSVISWSLYAIVGKRVSDSFSPLITTFYGFLTGTIILMPFGLLSKPGLAALPEAGWPAIGAVLYLALIASVLAFVWWNKGVAALGASRSSIFINLIPVATITISLFFRETITAVQIAGGILVIGAVMLTTGEKPAPLPELLSDKRETARIAEK